MCLIANTCNLHLMGSVGLLLVLCVNNTNINMETNTSGRTEWTISRIKEVLPQVLAICAANTLVVVVTIVLCFSTLVIGDVHNKDGPLSMNDTQASWFGSLPFFCHPVGSIASGFVVQWLGRKRTLVLINIPYCVGLVMLSVAPSVTVLFLANILLGFSVGFIEAPLNSYFGEICEPKFRSVLAGSAAIFYQCGLVMMFVLGSLLHWKTTAAVLAVTPVISILCMWQVPESPTWLIAKGRKEEARSALCWLRGWVEPSAVQHEFEELVKYHDNIKKKQGKHQNVEFDPEKDNLMGSNGIEMKNIVKDDNNNQENVQLKTTIVHKLKLITGKETMRPLVLTVLFFAFNGMAGMFAIRPFLIEVLEKFHVPLDAKWSTVLMTATGFLGSVLFIATIHLVGKRKMALVSTALCAVCCILLGFYAYFVVAPAARTGNQSYIVATWLPIVLFPLFALGNTLQSQLPWLLVAEAFPYRTRGVAGGLSAASSYLIGFFAARTYLSIEQSFQLFGAFWFFGAISVICFVYLYFKLPETEGKTLQEIEKMFATKNGRRN